MAEYYLKYAGARFVRNAPQEEINAFHEEVHAMNVALYNVVNLLEQEGLITLVPGDSTTIDQDMEEFLIPNAGDDF